MSVLLLPAAFVALALSIIAVAGLGLRQAFAAAAVALFVFASVSAELLSAAGAVTPTVVRILWVAAAGGAALFAVRARAKLARLQFRPTKELWPFVAVIGFALAVGFVTAVCSAPNTWDSLVYHLPRVLHWQQEHALSVWPTNIPKQDTYPPLYEVMALHVRELDGSDRFVNLVEWWFFVPTIVLASLVAEKLGASTRGQALAAALAATLPTAVVEGSSAQTDMAGAFGVVAVAYYSLELAGERRRDEVLLAFAAALAIFGKGTAYFFVAPFLLWAFVRRVRSRRIAAALRLVALVAAALLVVNTGHWVRTYRAFGSPLASNDSVRNEVLSPQGVISNLVRNVAMHFNTPWPAWNSAIDRAVSAFHRPFGWNVSDERLTYPRNPFYLDPWLTHEDRTTDGPAVLLILVALGLVLWKPRTAEQRPFAFALLFAAALYCLFIRWQPWAPRLHLPLLLCGLALAAARLGGSRNFAAVAIALSTALALPFLFGNTVRPWFGAQSIFRVPRELQYFFHRPELAIPYDEATALVSSRECAKVGLISGPEEFEYPLWLMLGLPADGSWMRHFEVRNPTATLPQDREPPCAVLTIARAVPDTLQVEGQTFQRAYAKVPAPGMEPISVFLPVGQP